MPDPTKPGPVASAASKREVDGFRSVVEALPGALIMVSEEGLIEMVNDAATRLFGYGRDEMIGRPVEMLMPAQFQAQHPALRQSFQDDPSPRPLGQGRDLSARRKDGSAFPVEIGLNTVAMAEGVKVLCAVLDLSDRKQKEQHIERALREKDLLLGEIHHRVKNHLQIAQSLLELQAGRLSDPAAVDALRNSKNRIQSMAHIHQMLCQSTDVANVDFGHFLRSFVPILVASYAVNTGRIGLSIMADNMKLPVASAIPCGLIVNELISNALKHAFPDQRPGEIVVDLRRESDGLLRLSVGDDGIGLLSGFDIRGAQTLGLQLVGLLADQLQGRLVVNTADPTRFSLIFPG